MWTAHQVVFELLSPLHVGYRRIGNLAATRRYVPGRAIWGALTSRICRNAGGQDYADFGQRVQAELAWTYFFASATPDYVPLWPWDGNTHEFEWLHLGSRASTALEDGHGAEEGALHEVEYIAPRTRSGERVYLTGYLFEREGSTLDWRGSFNRFQIGGERSYGWGRVRPFSITPPPGSLFGIYPAYTNAERPIIEVFGGQALVAHALASDSDDHPGAIEPLVGRETDPGKAAFGVLPSVAAVCWAPGTRIAQNQKYRITAHGIWESV